MIPAKINTTGNDQIDTLTAELAVILRDTGCTEREAVQEAERLRNRWVMAVMFPVARLAENALKGVYGCECTGWDGCPDPSACGTPDGCHCGG